MITHRILTRLPMLPVFRKQIKEHLLTWMGSEEVLVQRDTKPRPRRQREVPICCINLRLSRNCLVNPGISEVVEVLLNLEIRRAGCQVQRRRRSYRATHIIVRDVHLDTIGGEVCENSIPCGKQRYAAVR